VRQLVQADGFQGVVNGGFFCFGFGGENVF